VAAAACLGAAAAGAAIAGRRLGEPVLTAPNLLTLSRAGAAAMACGTAFSGRGRGSTLVALLLGCTVCDWLDGPLARRLGPTALGAALDIETDSWLTLWGAVAAFRLGGLPGLSLLPPALRYPLAAGRPAPLRAWQRAAGVAQMVVIAWALARRPPRALAAAVAAGQLAALAASAVRYGRRHGNAAHHVPAPRLGDGSADRPLRRPAP